MNDVVDLFPPGAHARRRRRPRRRRLPAARPRRRVRHAGLRGRRGRAARPRARVPRRAGRALAGESLAIFASKAFPCTAVLRAVAEEGLGCDVAGAGELVHALAAGVDPRAHLPARQREDRRGPASARSTPASGTVVIDNLDDVDRLERLVRGEQGVLVRVIPGVRPDTHAAVATGQEDSKFGLAPARRAPGDRAPARLGPAAPRRAARPHRLADPRRRAVRTGGAGARRARASSRSTTSAAGSAPATPAPIARPPWPSTSTCSSARRASTCRRARG